MEKITGQEINSNTPFMLYRRQDVHINSIKGTGYFYPKNPLFYAKIPSHMALQQRKKTNKNHNDKYGAPML